MKLYDIQEPNDDSKTLSLLSEEGQQKSSLAVGIDLGTTNSLVAISKDQDITIIPVSGEHRKLLPSIIYYDTEHKYTVGKEALKSQHYLYSIKRLMGKGLKDLEEVDRIFPIHPLSSDEIIYLDIGNKPVTAVEASAAILKQLKEAAENFLKQEVTKAVITVPAYFGDAARTATQDAAKIAGLEVLRLMSEPTAAAFAYGLQNKASSTFAVYDLGGGTFDISILKMQQGILKVIATAGDVKLGGDDFDYALAKLIYNKCQQPIPKDHTLKDLLKAARKIKEWLSSNQFWKGEFGPLRLACQASREEFSEAVWPLVLKTIKLLNKALRDAGCEKDDIQETILVGGSTRIPLIKEALTKMFNKPPLDNFNPDEIVAAGAAIQAESLNFGGSHLLLDVTPLSLGIELVGDIVEIVIPRNTPIPATATKLFTTSQDNQTAFKIHVLQGEGEKVEFCRSLGKFELKNIPPATAGVPRLAITFHIDADGILTVLAEEQLTKIKQFIEVKPSYGLSEEDLQKLIKG